MVHPSDDGLQQIRDGIADADRPWWQHPAALAVAAAVVLGVVVGAGVAFLGGDDEGTTSWRDRRTAPPASASDRLAERDPDLPRASTPIPIEGDVYVYYVMDDGQWPRACSASSGPTRAWTR